LKRINPDRPEGIDGNLWDRLTADLRGLVWQNIDKDGSFTTFAAKSNLHPTTITNFAYGWTRSPLLSTIVKLMVALDRVDLLVAAFSGNAEPISASEAQKRFQKRRK